MNNLLKWHIFGRHHHDKTGRYCYRRIKPKEWLVQDNALGHKARATSLVQVHLWINVAKAMAAHHEVLQRIPVRGLR